MARVMEKGRHNQVVQLIRSSADSREAAVSSGRPWRPKFAWIMRHGDHVLVQPGSHRQKPGVKPNSLVC